MGLPPSHVYLMGTMLLISANTLLSLTSIISSVLTEPKGTDIESVAVALLLVGRNTTRLVRVAQTRTRGEKWGDRPGSNRRQPESQSGALPTELRPPLEEKL